MDAPVASDISLFSDFRLHLRGGGLFRCVGDGGAVPVRLGARALEVLRVLVEHHGQVVSKDQIMSAVWPETIVEEANLTMQISALRRALDSDGSDLSCIQTVPGRGYRFISEVRQLTAPFDLPAVPAVPASTVAADPTTAPDRRRWLAAIAMGVTVMVVTLSVGAWWTFHDTTQPRPVAYSLQDRRQSVAILPFETIGGDPAQAAMAAAFTRDVTSVIANDSTVPLVPIAATASPPQGPDLRAIGRDHDVHFILSGSARRQDGRLIVSATLYQTEDQRPTWSQQFDRPDQRDDWNDIVTRVAYGFEQATMDAESARAMREHPDSLDKRDLMFASRVTSMLQTSEEIYKASLALMERALVLDPDYVWALREDARMRANIVGDGYSADPEADLARATQLLDRALLIKPNDAMILREKANVMRAQGDLDGAAALLRRLIERLPQQAMRYRELGVILLMQGHPKEALDYFLIARRLAVDSDSGQVIDANIAVGLLANDRLPEAITQARLAIAEYPNAIGRGAEFSWLVLIAAENANGQETEARADLQKYLAGPSRIRTIEEVRKLRTWAVQPRAVDALYRAGMPDSAAAARP